MSFKRAAQPLSRHLRNTRHDRFSITVRNLSATAPRTQETTETTSSDPPPPLPSKSHLTPEARAELVYTPSSERRLFYQHGVYPIGSRRRRAAMQTSANIPFQQLPYQCFQEARKFLQEDRKEKVDEIQKMREKIARLKSQNVAPQNEAQHEHRIRSMRKRLEDLKIYADINDPLVKKKFEDGDGDMNKPIYRHLSSLKWHSYKRKLLMQRVEQMNVVPDILPHVDPSVSTVLSFDVHGRPKKIPHGDMVPSLTSQSSPTLTIQPYDAGKRLVTIAVVTPDVPNVEKDAFDYRCHFLACNVPISPTETEVHFAKLTEESQVLLPWLSPYSQKGAPYQRLGIFILEQPELEEPRDLSSIRSQDLDVSKIKEDKRYSTRENFILRSFAHKYRLKPVGVDLFRTQWDEGTATVMRNLGIPGADVEFKRKRIEPLPYQRLKSERYR